MATVKVSPKFQVVIPKSIRNKMEIKVGQQFQLIQYGDRIEFIPVKRIKDMKGFLQGIDTNVQRENDRI
ncbi:MAG: AbrB/MazE/SpoVT family DNA-binding domain-containing protein [bacterium]